MYTLKLDVKQMSPRERIHGLVDTFLSDVANLLYGHQFFQKASKEEKDFILQEALFRLMKRIEE